MRKRQTVISMFDDSRITWIFKQYPDSRLITKRNQSKLYIESKNERYIFCENWNMSVADLSLFMAYNGSEYNYTTPSAFSMSLWRSKFFKDRFDLHTDGFKYRMLRDSLYGGRCEVIRYANQELTQYDINSSYPFSATQINSWPKHDSIEYAKKPTISNIFDYNGVSKIAFEQYSELPFLPNRANGRNWYANGVQVGTYTHAELRNAIDQELIRLIDVKKQYIALKDTGNNPFSEFVAYCYQQRLDSGMKIWKVIMNSLFGRLAANGTELLKFRIASNRDEVKNRSRDLKMFYGAALVGDIQKTPIDNNVLWSSMVLSHARNNLYQLATKTNALYMDTDCVFTEDKTIDENIGELIGQLKRKTALYNIRGAKNYMVGDEIKMKGVSKKHRKLHDFFASRYTNERRIIGKETQPFFFEELTNETEQQNSSDSAINFFDFDSYDTDD